jgi:predicted ATPase/class 3 adenylate cyclase
MKCPECQTENPETRKFCSQCGAKLSLVCPQCDFENLPDDRFCGGCGQSLEATEKVPTAESERKQVTVLFSDLSGYTALSEKLDPEDVREIMSRIFGEIAQVVARYEGFVEKFIGDAVVAFFGVPKAHEDDPVRAIRAAREIHDLVRSVSPEIEEQIGEPLFMHTGVNTGLVVTGEVHLEGGTHGASGDTINLASRLSSLAGPGEILVGPETHRQIEDHFVLERLEPTRVKGKADPVQIHRVISPREGPVSTRRLSGLRSELIGRKAELDRMTEAIQRLREGKGTICLIQGEAGTGKSRLVEELKSTLEMKEIQWTEGHAHAYSQNIPYFPLVDLLSRAWQIEEGDPPEKVRNKVETAIERLVAGKGDVVPYIGSLYSISYPQIEGVSPEFWKRRLHDAVLTILSALVQRAPTIICLEDLHWADPSSLDLLRGILSEFRHPALFLCVSRPPFSLFTSHQMSGIRTDFEEVRLHDLSPSDTQDMLESLLKTTTIPVELKKFVHEKAEGNPFYMEEVTHSLIESETLIRDNGGWKLTKPIGTADLPPTVHGVISARLDRLETEMKRTLQEASVIGRAFLYDILKQITTLRNQLDRCLGSLDQLDLIQTRSLQPDLEYIFKHAMTQEVVYNGLLKKDRQALHERIGCVMEGMFPDRLSELCETLAYHFKQGQSTEKAVDYLIQSGEKGLRRYAVEESHLYFKEAYDLLLSKEERTREEDILLIDLLIKWAYVFYYRGDIKGLVDHFCLHQDLAESIDDRTRLGMFYAWLGFGLDMRDKLKESYEYLTKALEIGQDIENPAVVGYACAWLSWTCAELGLLDEAIEHGERAQKICKSIESDQYLYFKSLGGLGYAYFHKGESRKALEAGKAILDYGEKHSNIRSQVMGLWIMGFGYQADGDYESVAESCKRALQISADPYYSQLVRILLGICCYTNGQTEEAKGLLQEVVDYSERFGSENVGTIARLILIAASITEGQMGQALKEAEEILENWKKNGRKGFTATSEYYLGKLYLDMAEGTKSIHDIAREIGAKSTLGRALLALGLVRRSAGDNARARASVIEAIETFERCEIETDLKRARGALADLD